MLITNKAQYTCHKALIWLLKGEFDMLYLCAGGGGAMMFSFDKSTSLEGGSEKNPEIIRGGFTKMKGKNKEIIKAHPLDKL